MFFVIRNNDGNTRIDMLAQDELERRINERYYGEQAHFLAQIPNTDTNYWSEHAVLIIRGEIAIPEPREVVTRYTL